MPSSSTADATLSCKKRFECREPLYKNSPYCLLHFPGTEKIADFEHALRTKLNQKDFNFRGVWFPEDFFFFKGLNFDARAIFCNATFNAPATFIDATFSKEADFSDATFKAPVTFRNATFSALAKFSSAIFEREASFHTTSFKAKADFGKGKVDFSQAKFRGHADFSEATFEEEGEHNFWDAKFLAGTNFEKAKFEGRTNFDAVTFKGETNFNYATFNEAVNFCETIFQDRVFFEATAFTGDAKFFHTSFKDYVRFRGQVFLPGSRPDFRAVKSVELISFYSLTSRPHWFVDLNASKFALTNVRWEWRRITINREIGAIARNYKHLSPYPLLERACRNLAINAEENHRYEEASKFRYMAMNARRKGTWRKAKKQWKRFGSSLSRGLKLNRRLWKRARLLSSACFENLSLPSLYWAGSGYGERILRAFIVLIGIWLLFAFVYALTLNDKEGKPLGWRALTYSAAVIMLQKPEPVPATPTLHGLVILETVLGPVQAALLALAIRRKFMR